MAERISFDHEAFFSALDSARQAKNMNWRQVAQEAHVSQSTLTRLAQKKRPDVDSLAALVAWAGLDANLFLIQGQETNPEPLAMISTYLKADRNLSPQAAEAIDRVVKATYEALREA